MVDDGNLIDEANKAALRVELATKELNEANRIKDELLKKEEQLINQRLLGGKSSAGEKSVPPMTEEEQVKADGRNYFKGGMLEQLGVFK